MNQDRLRCISAALTSPGQSGSCVNYVYRHQNSVYSTRNMDSLWNMENTVRSFSRPFSPELWAEMMLGSLSTAQVMRR